jgi:hypothetical protein
VVFLTAASTDQEVILHQTGGVFYFSAARFNTDGRLEFDVKIIPYEGDTSWVEQTILYAVDCLKGDKIPDTGLDCDYCKYYHAVNEVLNK